MLSEKSVAGWLIAFVFYGIGIIGIHMFPNIFCIWTACQYILYFFLGMRIQANEEEQFIESVPWYLWIVADLAVFAGTIIIGRKNGTLYSIIAVGLCLILHMVGSIMAWKILQTLADKVKWKSSKAFEAMSAYSMPMYLFHQQIIYFTIVWLNGVVNPWVNAGVNFVVAIIGAFLLVNF